MLWRETKRADAPLGTASAAGTVEGYASLFGVADTGGDIVMAGAFARSLARRGATGVKMLWQHKAAEPIGVWTSLMEDARGLKAVGRLDLDVARAREALSLMKTGAVDGLSIGFRAQRADRDRKSGLRRLHEIDLWEISIVTFPMLPAARVDKVKRRTAADAIALARLQARRTAWDFQRKLHQLRRD
jgi:hypothetical protein